MYNSVRMTIHVSFFFVMHNYLLMTMHIIIAFLSCTTLYEGLCILL